MSLKEEVEQRTEELFKKGKERGWVTYDEVNQVFTNDAVWSPYLEELFNRLEEEGIEMIDSAEKKQDRKISNPTNLYFQDIAKIPLVSHEKEIELCKEMEKQRMRFSEMASQMGIPNRKLAEVFKNQTENEDLQGLKEEFKEKEFILYTARRKMIEANLRLVVTIAKRYASYSTMEFLDLINEGNIGLIRAVDKYDYKEGYRFSTYAVWWIRQAIFKALTTESRIIRLPASIFEAINRSMKAQEELTQKLARSPSMEELATKMGMALNKVLEIMVASEKTEVVSLDTPIDDNGRTLLLEVIEDKISPSPADIVFLQILQDQISDVLSNLSERDKAVIKMRFGLDGEYPHTLEEIGKKIGITREGVRQIETKVLSRLRKRQVVKTLKDDFL
ncbi:MAG: sigma-70 family RNA polymerase sigma factor [bacterium]|nr:sigma-70 family RNA polymerase sigma factor [bacterium]